MNLQKRKVQFVENCDQMLARVKKSSGEEQEVARAELDKVCVLLQTITRLIDAGFKDFSEIDALKTPEKPKTKKDK
jgi:hypothetical protein